MEPSGFAGVPQTGDQSVNAEITALRAEVEGLRGSLSAALQTGLERVAARTEARLDDVVDTLGGRLTARLDATAADLRRTLNAALDVQVDAAALTQATTADTRSALESRAVVVEAAVTALAERVETLSREGAESARQQVRALGADLATLRQWVDPVENRRLRTEAQARLDNALVSRDQRLLGTVSDLLTAVTSERVATQTRLLQLEDTASRVLDALLALDERGASRAATTAQQVDALLTGTQDRVDAVRSDVRSQLAQIREELSSELGTLRSELHQVSADSAAAGLAVETLPIRLEQALSRAQGAMLVDAAPAGQSGRTALLQLLAEHRTEVTARMDEFAELVAATGASTGQALQAVSEQVRRATGGTLAAAVEPAAGPAVATTPPVPKTRTQKAAKVPAASPVRKPATTPRRSPAAAVAAGRADAASPAPRRSRATSQVEVAVTAPRRSPAAKRASARSAEADALLAPAGEQTEPQPARAAPRRATPAAAARRDVRPSSAYQQGPAPADTAAQARADAEQIEPVRKLFARRRP